MPAVLIHGVPDTYRVWDKVRGHLSRNDVAALSLPGFGSSTPKNFGATKEEYVTWLICQMEQMSGPIDLVGHDWGCILAMRVASLRPDLIRSLAAGSGPVSRSYEWHALAKIWQTPEEGERWMRDLNPVELADFMVRSGVPLPEANDTVSRIDERMRDCILRLYRSAVHVGAEWQPDLGRIRASGLVIWGERDAACPIQFADELAVDAHARGVLKLDCDHWTLLERSAEVAAALQQHWAACNDEQQGLPKGDTA